MYIIPWSILCVSGTTAVTTMISSDSDVLKGLLENNKYIRTDILKEMTLKTVYHKLFNNSKTRKKSRWSIHKFVVIDKMKLFQSPRRAHNHILYKEVRNMCKMG